MKILVLGAGGTGGYFGGRMAAAGRDVTFLVRPARKAALDRDGLKIVSPFGDLALKVRAETVPAGPADMVLLSAKAYDLPAAIAAIAPAMGPATQILPLLNGMAHIDALDAAFGAPRVLGGVAHIAATLAPDGTVKHLNKVHAITQGARAPAQEAAARAIAAAMSGCGFDAIHSPTIIQAMWEKWCLLAPLAAITCLMRGSVGAILAAGGEPAIRAVAAECAAVAGAAGHAPRPEATARALAALTEKGSPFTASMLRDLEAGGRIEGDHVIGDLVARARKAGVATPLLDLALVHLKTYEQTKR